MVEYAITQVLVGQGTKCKDIWQLWVYRVWYLISSATGVPSIDNCLVLGECWESPKRLQRLFRSSTTPLDPITRDQSRQQRWPELAVCTRLALGVNHGCLGLAGAGIQTHTVVGTRAGSKGTVVATGVGSDCQHILPWRLVLATGAQQ